MNQRTFGRMHLTVDRPIVKYFPMQTNNTVYRKRFEHATMMFQTSRIIWGSQLLKSFPGKLRSFVL